MWNYHFVVPNITLIVLLFIFYFLQPHVPISKNRAFLRVLVVEFLVIALDIAASRFLEFYNLYPRALHLTLNILYFIAFFVRSLLFYHFSLTLFTPRSQVRPKRMLLSYSVFDLCVIITLLNFFVPTLFILDDAGYHRGSLYNVLYVCAFFYPLLSVILLVINRKKMRTPAFVSALVFNSILIIGYCMRLCFPKVLLMDFFCLIVIIIMYLSFENSAYYIEGRTGAFNQEALRLLLGEKEERHSLLLGIQIQNYEEIREIYTESQVDEGITLIAHALSKTYPELSLFYIHNGRFVLVGNNALRNIEKVKSEVRRMFDSPWICSESEIELFLDINFVDVNADFNVTSPDKIMQGLLSAFNSTKVLSDKDISISSETLKSIERSAEIKRAVRHAVESENVEMFLQPLVRAEDHSLIGAEALARIRDDDGMVISPDIFIPVAEKDGHINRLGEQMFEKACKFVASHDLDAMGLSWVNVNLSPLQFLSSDLNERFSEILKKHNVSAEKIHLEITEASMIDYAVLQKQIQKMKSTGFEFVLDDFGTGYSNVMRLNQYPFINIKFDMQVVWEYFKSKEEILPALVQAFKNMGFTVTAEGIEDENMAEGMRALGCDYLQGYHFSKPLPAEEFASKYGK